jgi:hypothetical protein
MTVYPPTPKLLISPFVGTLSKGDFDRRRIAEVKWTPTDTTTH